MAYLTNEIREELLSEDLIEKKAVITNGDSIQTFTLNMPGNHGMKGVVWLAKNYIGSDVAIKIIPEGEYIDHSILDEMTEVSKLDSPYFAKVIFFGDVSIKETKFESGYKAIVTEWIEGEAWDGYVEKHIDSVNQFINLTDQIYSALASLRSKGLCHDDLHPGNIKIMNQFDPLLNENQLLIKIIDTGTIKRSSTRNTLLNKLRKEIKIIEDVVQDENNSGLIEKKELLKWKEPDDHLRVVECLLHAANALIKRYSTLDFWERKFVDSLTPFFQRLTDEDLGRRLDEPQAVVRELRNIINRCKTDKWAWKTALSSPFDFISAEMITNDKEFSDLFSRECPWLSECSNIEPIYIYGPRGCGKSSVLRWLSFKTIMADGTRKIQDSREIGIYISCSVELRSRFWLFTNEDIDRLQGEIIQYFSMLLLEELFDTLCLMLEKEKAGDYQFGLSTADTAMFTKRVLKRINPYEDLNSPRLQGQSTFEYLKGRVRRIKWDVWKRIQSNNSSGVMPDPNLAADICRFIPEFFEFFRDRYITFLIDDYSNQRIPEHLQIKLNKTISFAKQGTPIFKVTSEYQGVNLEGIQEG